VGPLSNDQIIRFISENFVPVALLDHEIRNAKDAAGEFFRSVNKEMFINQGIHVASPDGKALASSMPGRMADGQEIKSDESKPETWINEVQAALERGLKRFGAVMPRRVRGGDWLPSDGVGVLPDGSAPLVSHTRVMQHGLARPDCFGSVTFDSVTLSAKEWQALAPVQIVPETEWAVPEAVSRKFNMVLSTSCNDSLPRPEELVAVKFTAKVESVSDGVAYLRYDGHLAGAHRSVHGHTWTSQAKVIAGVGAYDVKGRRMLSVTMIFEGERRNSKYSAPSDAPEKFGAVLEWRRELRKENAEARSSARP
jgi:hypothetical protein